MIFGHGDDTYRYGDKVKINFSSNIYQKADLSELEAYLSQHLDVIRHYPAPVAQELEEMIAAKLGIPANMVMVTSGSNEAIYLIAQLYRGWASVIPQPTYHEYEDACKLFGHLISYERTADLDTLPQDRIYWICNPDNPSGNVLLKPLLMRIIKNADTVATMAEKGGGSVIANPTQANPMGIRMATTMVATVPILVTYPFFQKYFISGITIGAVKG